MADHEKLLRSHRRKPLFDPGALPLQVDYRRDAIQRIIPHRDPLLFVDRITGLDLEQGFIAGERTIPADDPVFTGHFPGAPLYPGNFTVEMIGQLGLCMYYFETTQTAEIASDAEPVPARATRIAGAYYLEPIPPGARVTLLARKIDFDGYFASMIGQALVDGKIAVVVIGEVMILGD